MAKGNKSVKLTERKVKGIIKINETTKKEVAGYFLIDLESKLKKIENATDKRLKDC